VFRPAPILQTLLALGASVVFLATDQPIGLAIIWPIATIAWVGWAIQRRRH
jgi:hypothetical protein